MVTTTRRAIFGRAAAGLTGLAGGTLVDNGRAAVVAGFGPLSQALPLEVDFSQPVSAVSNRAGSRRPGISTRIPTSWAVGHRTDSLYPVELLTAANFPIGFESPGFPRLLSFPSNAAALIVLAYDSRISQGLIDGRALTNRPVAGDVSFGPSGVADIAVGHAFYKGAEWGLQVYAWVGPAAGRASATLGAVLESVAIVYPD